MNGKKNQVPAIDGMDRNIQEGLSSHKEALLATLDLPPEKFNKIGYIEFTTSFRVYPKKS